MTFSASDSDNNGKVLSANQRAQAIAEVAREINIEPCLITAVNNVESNGQGFLPSGKPKILFEGHIFWRELKKAGYSNEQLQELSRQHPSVLYRTWTRQYYSRNPEKEYDRLAEARAINDSAALASASWGAFQIMGMNYSLCGFSNVLDFVAAQESGEKAQLISFINFLKNNGLVEYLKNRDWAGFARRYNGPGYAQNKYDEKLARAYADCLKKQG